MRRQFYRLSIVPGIVYSIVVAGTSAALADDRSPLNMRRQIAATNVIAGSGSHNSRRLPRPLPQARASGGDSDDNALLIERPHSVEKSAKYLADDDASLHQVSHNFARWLKHFGNPVVCDMVFCHTSCQDYDDSCPSFKRSVGELLFAQSTGCTMPQSQSPSVHSVLERLDSCCRK
ncbi:MAG TPA: hypothetical protein V6C97_35125 [Oculatellaceae cyanobacterium]